jgi:predicted Zn-dependent peptidase
MLNRKIQPASYDINEINFITPTIHQFNNNIPLYIFEGGDEEIIKIDFLFDAGNYYSDKFLIPVITNAMLREGAGDYNSEQIAEILEFYGASVRLTTNRDIAIAGLTFLSKHYEKILPVFEKIIKEPNFPEKELKIELNNRKQDFLIENKKTRFVAQKKFLELLFGKTHPYGNYAELSDFDEITNEQLKNFFKNNYNSKSCKIFIAGKFNSEVLKFIEKLFGDSLWGLNTEKNIIKFPIQSDINKIHTEKWDGSVQSSVRIGTLCFNRLHPDYYKFQFINVLLGGYFGSRLMKNIRENKGYTYGIYSSLVSFLNGGYFMIGSEIGSQYCNDAIDEIKKEIANLYMLDTNNDEIKMVKNYMIGQIMRSFDGMLNTSETYQTIIPYSLNEKYFYNFVNTINNITSEDIKEISYKYLYNPDWIEVIVGG